MRILIADDERTSTMMLRLLLEQWGFEVVVAHDGTAAWERIVGVKPPALAIVDWEMGTVGDPKLDLAWMVQGWPDDTNAPEAATASSVYLAAGLISAMADRCRTMGRARFHPSCAASLLARGLDLPAAPGWPAWRRATRCTGHL